MKDEKKLVADEEKAIAERASKRQIEAPCVFKAPDPRTGKFRDYFPSVNCDVKSCDNCGWNPEVARRRVDKMLAEVDARRRAEAAAERKARKKGASK